MQGFSEGFRVVESSREFEAFEVVKGKRSNVGPWRMSSQRKRRTVGILGGESAKSREPSDLTEEQVSYREYFRRF
jgi:hypothetical protein